MAMEASTPADVAAKRDYEKERAAIRETLSKLDASKDEKAVRDLNQSLREIDADETNSKREGIGTRLHVGQTRGKSPVIISWEGFDDSKPETLPKSVESFLEVAKLDAEKDEAVIVDYLIKGYNDAAYTSASDPLKEFVDMSWPDDAQTQFRLVVRNYSRGANVSLEDAVALIKPGFVKQFSK